MREGEKLFRIFMETNVGPGIFIAYPGNKTIAELKEEVCRQFVTEFPELGRVTCDTVFLEHSLAGPCFYAVPPRLKVSGVCSHPSSRMRADLTLVPTPSAAQVETPAGADASAGGSQQTSARKRRRRRRASGDKEEGCAPAAGAAAEMGSGPSAEPAPQKKKPSPSAAPALEVVSSSGGGLAPMVGSHLCTGADAQEKKEKEKKKEEEGKKKQKQKKRSSEAGAAAEVESRLSAIAGPNKKKKKKKMHSDSADLAASAPTASVCSRSLPVLKRQ